jgi:DNA-entry nuclease
VRAALKNIPKRIIRKITRKLQRRVMRVAKKEFKKRSYQQIALILSLWLGLSFPVSCMMTALTTPAQFSNPTQIAQTTLRSGVPNILSWGLAIPAFEGGKLASGNLFEWAGNTLKIDGLSQFGSDLAASTDRWFKEGYADLEGQFGATKTPGIFDETEEGWSHWSESQSPNYVRVIGEAVVDYSLPEGVVRYSPLDELGRTRRVVANINYEMYEESIGNRKPFTKGSDPSGWPSKNIQVSIDLPSGKTYNGYMYNRSHLLADSLGGDAQRHNLVTGTRMQNVGANDGKGGMAYTETKVRNYLKKNAHCTIYYSVMPVYHADELIPRSVIVDVKSCDGVINERVEVYNSVKGYTINYHTAEFVKN